MPNHLNCETSPYLLQHANNPVDWYPWGGVALERARLEDKPIFLSIGYSACHWCHVMEHESFEDPSIAEILNQEYISIKVDREERPDLDNIYMSAVVTMTGQGGWPLSIFLTPDMKPFYGGTYFPPIPRYRMPSFPQVLRSISRVWQEDRQKIEQSAEKISAYIQSQGQGISINPVNIPSIDFNTVVNQLSQSFDWKYGGWGNAPKFPNPMTIDFLLMLSERRLPLAVDMVNKTLIDMQRGGMFDLVNGGFHRYSTDELWCVPHFEKMLSDNAQLALVYLHAALITGNDLYRSTCEKTIDFILRELSHPEGGFYSSLDADSEGIEGQFYLWKYEEIERLLKDVPGNEAFFRRHHITSSGNFDGKIILHDSSKLEEKEQDFEIIYDLLRRAREERTRPATDDKIILSWNAMACRALAEAARFLERPDYLLAAQKNATFIINRLCANDQVFRTWRLGKPKNPALLEDYSALIIALVSLYQADYNLQWLEKAFELASTMLSIFSDSSGTLYDTPSTLTNLLFRPSNLQDNAIPSGGALTAMALLTLCQYTENSTWHNTALRLINLVSEAVLRYPLSYSYWLQVYNFEQTPVQQIALLYPRDDIHHQEFIKAINQIYSTHRITACSSFPPPMNAPELLQHRILVKDSATLYICRGFTCYSPITNQAEITEALKF